MSKRAKPVRAQLSWYIMWIAMILAILFFSVFALWTGFSAQDTTQNVLLKVVLGVAGIGLAMKMALDFTKTVRGMRRGRPVPMTLLKCSNCGTKFERKFEVGDYVGKVYGEACRRCTGSMEVDLVYVKSPQGPSRSR